MATALWCQPRCTVPRAWLDLACQVRVYVSHGGPRSTCAMGASICRPGRTVQDAYEWQPSPGRRRVQVTRSSAVDLVTSSATTLAATATIPGSTAGFDFFQSAYDATQTMDSLVSDQLAGVTPLTYAIILGAGLITSLSPCTLSVLPLTIGYIGGYSKDADGSPVNNLAVQSASFSLGLATTLALLGVASSLLGRAYGQIGSAAPIAVSVVAILMGLNLLEVLPLRLPSLDVDTRSATVPPALQAYLAGLTFALAASPCSTPILATLLAYVSSTRDPVQGGALLLAYTSGYVAPLLVAASFTGAIKQLLALRKYSAWVTPASGVLLITGGSYTLLTRLIPS